MPPARDSAGPAHPHRSVRRRDVDDLTALGDLRRSGNGQPAGGRTGGRPQVPPALRVEGARGLRRADGGLRPAPVEQLLDRPLEPRSDVVHEPSVRTCGCGRHRRPGLSDRAGGPAPGRPPTGPATSCPSWPTASSSRRRWTPSTVEGPARVRSSRSRSGRRSRWPTSSATTESSTPRASIPRPELSASRARRRRRGPALRGRRASG